MELGYLHLECHFSLLLICNDAKGKHDMHNNLINLNEVKAVGALEGERPGMFGITYRL